MTRTSLFSEFCCCGRGQSQSQRREIVNLKSFCREEASIADADSSSADAGDFDGPQRHLAAAAEAEWERREDSRKDTVSHSVPSSRTTSERSSRAHLFSAEPDSPDLAAVIFEAEAGYAGVAGDATSVAVKGESVNQLPGAAEGAGSHDNAAPFSSAEDETRSTSSSLTCHGGDHDALNEHVGGVQGRQGADDGSNVPTQTPLRTEVVEHEQMNQAGDFRLDGRQGTITPPSTPVVPETPPEAPQAGSDEDSGVQEGVKSSSGTGVTRGVEAEEGCITPPATPRDETKGPSSVSGAVPQPLAGVAGRRDSTGGGAAAGDDDSDVERFYTAPIASSLLTDSSSPAEKRSAATKAPASKIDGLGPSVFEGVEGTTSVDGGASNIGQAVRADSQASRGGPGEDPDEHAFEDTESLSGDSNEVGDTLSDHQAEASPPNDPSAPQQRMNSRATSAGPKAKRGRRGRGKR